MRVLVTIYQAKIGMLSRLDSLILHNDDRHGSIPSHVGECCQVSDCCGCRRTREQGNPRPKMETFSHLKSTDLTCNKCIGTVPIEFRTMKNLDSLVLNGNNLTGTIQPSLCQKGCFSNDGLRERLNATSASHDRHGSLFSLSSTK